MPILCSPCVLLPLQSDLALFQTRQQEERRQLEDLFALAGRDLKQGEIPSAFTCQAWFTACLDNEQMFTFPCCACCMPVLQQVLAVQTSPQWSGSVPGLLHV